jgi:hypothetical protein
MCQEKKRSIIYRTHERPIKKNFLSKQQDLIRKKALQILEQARQDGTPEEQEH